MAALILPVFYKSLSAPQAELDYHLLLASDLRFLDSENWERLSVAASEVKQMLASLIRKVRPTQARKLPARQTEN